jgi:hypothetical protein
MDSIILEKLIKGEKIQQHDITEALHDICDDEHSSCNNNCPVFAANGSSVPDTVNDFDKNRGCDCFKDGKAMFKFLKAKGW